MLGLALIPSTAGIYLAIRLWPSGAQSVPLEVVLAALALLSGAVLAVVVLVRYSLDAFTETADRRAGLELRSREAPLADGLTGLGDHRAFRQALERANSDTARRRSDFSLVLIDLDDLKVVNDRDGYSAGDELLRTLARTMRELSRQHDMLFRIGGDEFAMLLPGTDLAEATTLAERILVACKRPADSGRPFAFCGGVAGVPYSSPHGRIVHRQADAALHWAKRHGRGSVEVFDAQRDRLAEEVDEVSGIADGASGSAVVEVILGRLLRPVFQPIVDLRSGRILGFEGLIRPDPEGPLPDTARLFAAAAASGRTVELDLACIEAVVQGARAIGPDRLLTLNLSPRTLEARDFDAAWLLQGLVRNGISPGRVIIELTERDEVDDIGRLRQTFAALQQYGLRLAADDVGAGNAGLRLLSQVQFDIVKIDLTLVHDGVRRTGARAVLQSLRDLALSQDARIVAEGVETAEQLHVIRELQIGAGQGFLLGRPEVSVAKTFVDLRQLERGLLLPPAELPASAWATVPVTLEADDVDVISPERRAIFLPPAPARRLLEAEPGAA
jgi:diguanylate cyclase (GGDEF)-like protein